MNTTETTFPIAEQAARTLAEHGFDPADPDVAAAIQTIARTGKVTRQARKSRRLLGKLGGHEIRVTVEKVSQHWRISAIRFGREVIVDPRTVHRCAGRRFTAHALRRAAERNLIEGPDDTGGLTRLAEVAARGTVVEQRSDVRKMAAIVDDGAPVVVILRGWRRPQNRQTIETVYRANRADRFGQVAVLAG